MIYQTSQCSKDSLYKHIILPTNESRYNMAERYEWTHEPTNLQRRWLLILQVEQLQILKRLQVMWTSPSSRPPAAVEDLLEDNFAKGS